MSRVRAFTNMDCLILHMRSAKTLIRLRRCAGWSESSLVAQEKMEGKKGRSWPTNRSLLCRKCWSSEKKLIRRQTFYVKKCCHDRYFGHGRSVKIYKLACAPSEDSDQTGRMPRLIWVFAKRTFHFVCFGVRWLVLFYPMKSNSLPSMVNCIRWPYFIYNLVRNFANFYSNQKFYHPTVKVLIRLCWYAGWSGP